jgi:hypothetical protein
MIKKSKLCYDRRSVDQSVFVSSIHLGLTTRILLLSDSWGIVDVERSLDERTGLSFTIAAVARQRSHSYFRVSRDSWPYYIVSDSRLPQLGGPGPLIYIPRNRVAQLLYAQALGSLLVHLCNVHIMLKTLVLVPSPKLSNRNGQNNASARTTSKTPFLCCWVRVCSRGKMFAE